MKRQHNLVLLIVVVLLVVFPLWLVQKPVPGANGQSVVVFTGADDKAKNLISEINPNYLQWFEPLLEPASTEIASLLFALQAALGAGFIGYYLGVSITREKMQRKVEEQSDTHIDKRADAD